jgi:ring-1,2-phenylacetyl-CoA epoxidase subunit PaaE
MMQAVRKTLVSLGLPNEQISTEEFVSPRGNTSTNAQPTANEPTNVQSAVSESTVTFGTSNQTIDIDASTTILEAAEQAGVTLPWECRAGICGQCKVRCTTGRVRMDSRDALTKAEEEKGFILACQSHPITDSITIEA